MRRVDSHELAEWIAFDRIEPQQDGYWCAAMLAATVVNLFIPRGKTKAKVSDFYPQWGKPRPRQTPQDHEAIFSAIAGSINARLASGGQPVPVDSKEVRTLS